MSGFNFQMCVGILIAYKILKSQSTSECASIILRSSRLSLLVFDSHTSSLEPDYITTNVTSCALNHSEGAASAPRVVARL